MTVKLNATPNSEHELVLARLIDAPRERVWAAWTKPDLLKQWFSPAPWTTPVAEIDLRVGGGNFVTMRDTEGNDYPNRGQYLEVLADERLVFTDAYVGNWVPSGVKPFMTVVLTFEDEGGKTRYTARAINWTVEDREVHEKMGFHEGWALCTEQLEAVAKRA
jgi:uncharacterized protein YndB with AHSA1/START domain